MNESLLEDLNPPQREAVLHGEGPLLVLAGAGSGKTRVITRRVAHLVLTHGVAPWRILAVTFTNKAAREMKERLNVLLGPAANELVVSTFHSSAAMILRREAEHVGLTRSFLIYDDADQLSLIKRAMREAGVDPQINAREVRQRIDQAKNNAQLPDAMEVKPGDERGRQAQKAYRVYQKLLRAANAVDFGDLLLLLVQLFKEVPDVRRKYAGRFQHVLVDEFQDTNPVQYELLKLLAPPSHSNLVVVGDDDQSVYRWRGAEVDNILGFPRVYQGARVVKLEQNYRSDQNILSAANAVIAQNPRRMAKKLWSDRPTGEPLSLILNRDERAEGHEIARRIHALVREGFIPYSQVAVFYRANAQSRVLEEALRLARVPYALVSGRSFYERAEIKDASAYLRLMVNPRSDADIVRIINTPARGIGDTTVDRLTAHANARGISLFEALERPLEIPSLNGPAQKRLRAFREMMDALLVHAEKAESATEALHGMLETTQLVQALESEGSQESSDRAENLRELEGATKEFDINRATALANQGPEALDVDVPPLQAFLEQISLVADADTVVGEGRVSLMTLHAAKGLEYDAVFITGMEDGVFPSSRALDGLGESEELAEERRLCYVGFTRARRRLFLSLAQSRTLFGELRFNPPSRFLAEVPQELFDFRRELPQPPAGINSVPRYQRRREEDPDTYPQVDTSYDQSSDFAQTSDSVIGMRVKHSQFGEGKIIACDGSGPNAKLTVQFPSVGVKRVVARFLTNG